MSTNNQNGTSTTTDLAEDFVLLEELEVEKIPRASTLQELEREAREALSQSKTNATTKKVHQPKLYQDFILGGAASVTAVFFTNPLEVAKTRLQLQGELQRQQPKSLGATPTYSGVFDTIRKIVGREGLLSLQKGLGPAALFQIAMNGCRLGSFTVIRNHLFGIEPNQTSKPGVKNLLKNAAAGACAGAFGAAMGSPFFLVKTRLQSQSNSAANAVGHQYKYKNSFQALCSIFRDEGGIRGLYRGASASILRVSIGSSVQLSSYDQIKGIVLWMGVIKDGFYLHLASSLVTGLLVTTFMNPFDVMSTRMYNQRVEGGRNTLYKNPIDCLIKITSTEGIRGLYKGWTAHYLRLGPHTVLTFIFWEHLKKLSKQYNWFSD